AGSVADAFNLEEKFEAQLNEYSGNLQRAAVELAKQWRSDQALQKLEALLIVMDKDEMLLVSGSGEVIAPDDDILAIGSGGNFALAAATALHHHATDMSAKEIAESAIHIAGGIDIFTNENVISEEL
ncbi:HslU--HslV peptidase proteolytic subunit, partial [Levilactobacillus brevis]|nr:HslU--HslV peptidase proteolytic subunit [Levilactobacillus brevis]